VLHREVRILRASLDCSEMIPTGLALEVEKLAWYDRDPHKPIGLELDKRRRKLAAVYTIVLFIHPKRLQKLTRRRNGVEQKWRNG